MAAHQIRAIEREDLPACVQVIREGFATVAKEFGLTEQNCPTNGAFMTLERLDQACERGDLMVGLFAGAELAGFAQLTKAGRKAYELEKLTVLPQYRHEGLGGVLLGYVRSGRRRSAQKS